MKIQDVSEESRLGTGSGPRDFFGFSDFELFTELVQAASLPRVMEPDKVVAEIGRSEQVMPIEFPVSSISDAWAY
jgi:hypothetical protein